MSRKGNCWDNAVTESFFHTLKTEMAIFEYIEVFYNRKRLHSTNAYMAPAVNANSG